MTPFESYCSSVLLSLSSESLLDSASAVIPQFSWIDCHAAPHIPRITKEDSFDDLEKIILLMLEKLRQT